MFIQWVQQARKSKKCPRNSASGNPQNFQRFVLKVNKQKVNPKRLNTDDTMGYK